MAITTDFDICNLVFLKANLQSISKEYAIAHPNDIRSSFYNNFFELYKHKFLEDEGNFLYYTKSAKVPISQIQPIAIPDGYKKIDIPDDFVHFIRYLSSDLSDATTGDFLIQGGSSFVSTYNIFFDPTDKLPYCGLTYTYNIKDYTSIPKASIYAMAVSIAAMAAEQLGVTINQRKLLYTESLSGKKDASISAIDQSQGRTEVKRTQIRI